VGLRVLCGILAICILSHERREENRERFILVQTLGLLRNGIDGIHMRKKEAESERESEKEEKRRT